MRRYLNPIKTRAGLYFARNKFARTRIHSPTNLKMIKLILMIFGLDRGRFSDLFFGVKIYHKSIISIQSMPILKVRKNRF